MKKIYIVCLSIAICLTLKVSNAQTQITFYTSKGTFVAMMYDTLQPITTGNFIGLVNRKFYDGIIFHRVVKNFVVQGGDPTGTGTGGSGVTIPDEFDSRASNIQKAFGMANSGPNTGTSQFFINLVNNTYLDANYPVFGIVISNFSVVQAIGNVAVDVNDKPLVPVVMDSVRVTQAYVGIQEINKKSIAFNVFPNPAHDQITLDLGPNFSSSNGYKMKITNLLGKVLFTTSLSQQQTTVDLTAISEAGLYFLQVTDACKTEINRKIIKQ